MFIHAPGRPLEYNSRVLLADFDYELPPELIAQHPPSDRASSRLMVLDRKTAGITHARFRDLPSFLTADDLLVLNDTRVFPARLNARREGAAGTIEVLLLKQKEECVWEVLLRPGRKARPGTRLIFAPGLEAEVLQPPVGEEMTRLIRFAVSGDFWEHIERIGKMPLPPYIERDASDDSPEDRVRYQTVYARSRGSVAAPTAGLHFTPELLAELRHVQLTLHVGYGTFQPVRTEVVEEHRMHHEEYEIREEAASKIQEQLERGRRIVAVGTTSTRVLEHIYAKHKEIRAERGSTGIFIYPGFVFRVTGALITNFHLPKSTLLLLVSAFAGTELIKWCYQEAIREKYRFYSYGDAMLIV